MRKFSNWPFILIIGFVFIGNSSCFNNADKGTKTPSKDSVATWVNPRKGKIWEKENIVKIPLTAAENKLVGQVKSVTYKEYEFSEKEGDNTKTLVDSGFNVYDKTGHLIDQNEYYGDKMPKWHCLYKYDEKNKPNEWDLHIYEDNMNSKTTFKYDDKGNKIEEVTTDSNKEYARKTTFKYDDKGNEVEADMYDQDGKLKQIITYQYNEKSYQVAYTDKTPDGEVNFKMTCAYDGNGNKTSGVDYTSDTAVAAKWAMTNDAMGRRTAAVYYYPDGSIQEKRNIKYDDHGFPVEYNTNKPDGSLDEEKSYSYKNEYDKTGNIIKQTEIRWRDGKRIPATYSEFEITYY